ncbi:MAG: heat-inducible transcriptional repressor HrcA [Hyphomicrobiales bacterium]|nr:MAG: heat-inducible transcriptional repressor HrcA [Hyphomicrobiales bacterium]
MFDTELDERTRQIFRQIVDSYLESGTPVGSRNLSRVLSLGLSPASIRNVMSDLEHMGLIYAPHTSAGRLPTERGLRFFVDAMLEVGSLDDQARQEIDAQVGTNADPVNGSVLTHASQMLSGLSRGAGLVLTGKREVPLKHIEFVRIEEARALVVLVAQDGTVENRILDIPKGMPPSALVEASNFLNASLRGRTLEQAKNDLSTMMESQKRELDDLTAKLVEAGFASWAGMKSGTRNLIVRGRANLLDDLSVGDDLERVRLLFEDLENKSELIELLDSAESGDGVRIFIGSENNLFSLSGSSLVVAPYHDSDDNVVGVLGVIGPTRINYGRIIPVVNYTAQLLGKMLS